ncbi:pseudouridine synthase [Pantanalinema rosaneae CENA516]|uniref:RluA family pseudouridine synthase n=1 Tax=Pantanalinema rosaneae TaxID=1620701 RepID=UPI003D6EF2D9
MSSQEQANYWYEGRCPRSGDWLRLPRTPEAEAIARELMQALAMDDRYAREGKMYGILLVETATGERQVLKAFSGLLQGAAIIAGWVPPIPGRDRVALAEAQTLAALAAIKQELIALHQLPERSQYAELRTAYDRDLQQLTTRHQQRKQSRHQQRQLLLDTLNGESLAAQLRQLEQQSQRDGIERRQWKRQRNAALMPLQQILELADHRIQALKQQRRTLSRQLQTQMHRHYWMTNFAGESLSLEQVITGGAMPTGTGECCAPKLLHYAATHGLRPIAMAEFWWGGDGQAGDKLAGEFYGACVDRCQPLMGFLLSGLSSAPTTSPPEHLALPIIYADDWLIAVNKPAGLLSVPGRYHDRQDSVLSRLRHGLPDGDALLPAHRLDQETSGVLLFARDRPTYHAISQQFQHRTIRKQYEAILAGQISQSEGIIDLPLWGDPNDRPRQQVHEQWGKPSQTQFHVLAKTATTTRIALIPITGRTHQLRVHAADARGLGTPILGDRLYGCLLDSDRLYLHAKSLQFRHPQSEQLVLLQVDTPF